MRLTNSNYTIVTIFLMIFKTHFKSIVINTYFMFGFNFFTESSSYVSLVSKYHNNLFSCWTGWGARANLVKYELHQSGIGTSEISIVKQYSPYKHSLKIDINIGPSWLWYTLLICIEDTKKTIENKFVNKRSLGF